jgi:hypothetical protein
MWSITNLEREFPRSPGRIEVLGLTPTSLTRPVFSPASLPNTGASVARAATVVPPEFSGTVTLLFRMLWDGPDGTDQRDGSVSVPVQVCPQSAPTTTTTTTSVTSTTRPTPVQQSVPPGPTTTTIPSSDTPGTTTTTTVPATPPDDDTAVAAATASSDEFPVSQAAVPVKTNPQFTG